MVVPMYERAEQLFHEAMAQGPRKRSKFLDERCAGNDSLREEVESLLCAHLAATTFLETPAADLLPAEGPILVPQPLNTDRVGAYRLVRMIASGGMGTVYEAEQDNPRRRVALKLMKHGLATRSTLRRFEHESQILGRLRHPGIAQIYEAGTHGDGATAVPYFAMEFIEGTDLIRHARARNLTPRQRLELFVRVCDAVDHGHQHGVIHRDLKPANILVDTSGQPIVIDFGVARLTESDIQQTTVQTDFGQLVGTIPYMSPEQLAGDSGAIDARSDVYALGVVGYELLTGRLPYDLVNKALPEAIRTIRYDDPTLPGSIDVRLRGDLDTILGKALEKEKERRYRTASEFATDIRRYLADQPVSARPPSAIYQLRKFARRNRAMAGGAALGVLGLMVGLAVAAWQAVEATGQRNRAQAEAATAERISDFLESILASANPKRPSQDRSLRRVLEEAALRVDAELGDDPLVEASVRRTIGMTYHGVGDLDAAERHLRKAWDIRRTQLAGDDVEEGYALNDLVTVLREKGDFVEAESLVRDALQHMRAALGDQNELVGCLLINLGEILFNSGATEEAMPILEEGLAALWDLRSETADSQIVETMGTLAYLLKGKGDLNAAIALARSVVDLERRKHGEDCEYVAGATLYLSEYVRDQGDAQSLIEAESLVRKAMGMFRRLGGDEDHNVAVCLGYLATIMNNQKRPVEAEALYRESVAMRRKLLGDDHYETAKGLYNLGLFLFTQNRLDEAESVFRELLAQRQRTLSPEHPRYAEAVAGLADTLCAQSREVEAATLLQSHYEALKSRLGDDDIRTRSAMASLDASCGEVRLLQP